jgi:hypothetical protein
MTSNSPTHAVPHSFQSLFGHLFLQQEAETAVTSGGSNGSNGCATSASAPVAAVHSAANLALQLEASLGLSAQDWGRLDDFCNRLQVANNTYYMHVIRVCHLQSAHLECTQSCTACPARRSCARPSFVGSTELMVLCLNAALRVRLSLQRYAAVAIHVYCNTSLADRFIDVLQCTPRSDDVHNTCHLY